MSEIKHFLRKQEFPQSAREAVLQLEQLCLHGVTFQQQQRLIQEIMEEFIFCEVDRRGIRKKRLNAIQELQLLDVLSHYLDHQKHEVTRNTVFLTLFHREGSSNNKMKVLGKLVSMAVAIKNMAVLQCSSVWMQQQGCTSDTIVNLVHNLVTDYFYMIPRSVCFLQDLPDISAHFTAHFITAATALYCSSNKDVKFREPPDGLLQLICSWITSNLQLCLTPLIANLQNALPRGSIVMPSLTPLPGLLRWCIEAPILNNSEEKHSTYSRLHLSILETIMESWKIRSQMIQREMMTTRDFLVLTDSFLNLLKQQEGKVANQNLQVALNRFGQALQVSLAMNSLHGNIPELCIHLRRLPEHRLLSIIIQKNRPGPQ